MRHCTFGIAHHEIRNTTLKINHPICHQIYMQLLYKHSQHRYQSTYVVMKSSYAIPNLCPNGYTAGDFDYSHFIMLYWNPTLDTGN